MSLAPILRVLVEQRPLTGEQLRSAIRTMVAGEANQAEMGALLALLATRAPTAEEIVAAATVLRENVERLPTTIDPDQIVDTCGTGGAPKTFNVSTISALVAASLGVKVAKHGNRSRTGRGSAEFLEKLGVNLEAPIEKQARAFDEVGICFCFAQRHHPTMRNVAPVRQALGFPTLFNLVAPLTNPAGAKRQVLGVYDARYLEPVAAALQQLGASKALVVHSDDGLDEISISAGTEMMVVTPDAITRTRIVPEELGLSRAAREQVQVEGLDDAVRLARAILDGSEHGAPRDAVLMGAAAALFVADRVPTLSEGVTQARAALEDGRAQAKLDAWIASSQR
ncbi:MAG TPA: anthranilate phosphoribosyltransferase [Polyangiales bacterium]|nr:anthranilate phosphoribosyltransferase [Polyangiales bacterium]